MLLENPVVQSYSKCIQSKMQNTHPFITQIIILSNFDLLATLNWFAWSACGTVK
jgi:hypothetical protein